MKPLSILRLFVLVVAGALVVVSGCGKASDRQAAQDTTDRTRPAAAESPSPAQSPSPHDIAADDIAADDLAADENATSDMATTAAPMASRSPEVTALPTFQRSRTSANSSFADPTASAGGTPFPSGNSPSASSLTAPSTSLAPTSLPSAQAQLSQQTEPGFTTVQVYYATDRARGPLPLSSYQVTGQKQVFMVASILACGLFLLSAVAWLSDRMKVASLSAMSGLAAGALAATIVVLGQANIEKHGVTYGGQRGALTRGICEVTVPTSHQRGMVERPSLLRFEFREDQDSHIVLTSAVELAPADFQCRLECSIAERHQKDLLVFIHGYNVDFESAVQRTAQIAVDLPFDGVPVCYSWPSQASLLGYSVDLNNSEWTTSHLKEFLLELASQSGATSINVIAHSMGNRAMTGAIQQISWGLEDGSPPMFDNIVLAAPDVDADRFRRDLAPSMTKVANQVTLYASSDDQALIASKQVHGYPRAGESGINIVVVPGVETIDVSGIDLSLLGHSYYGDNESMLRDLYEVVRARLPATQRHWLLPRRAGELVYWQLADHSDTTQR